MYSDPAIPWTLTTRGNMEICLPKTSPKRHQNTWWLRLMVLEPSISCRPRSREAPCNSYFLLISIHFVLVKCILSRNYSLCFWLNDCLREILLVWFGSVHNTILVRFNPEKIIIQCFRFIRFGPVLDTDRKLNTTHIYLICVFWIRISEIHILYVFFNYTE